MLQLTLDFLGRTLPALRRKPAPAPRRDRAFQWKHELTVQVTFRPRARRYLLRLESDGSARLVVPRRGTETEALRFLDRSEAWLLRRLAQFQARRAPREPWRDGTSFLYRGEQVVLLVKPSVNGVVFCFADQVIAVPSPEACSREIVLRRLRRLAETELPARVHELAQLHGVTVRRVTVRAQKLRWGSCSARGTISLNWRLLHAPAFVVDYLIVHELMHRREMNHSARYWRHVAEAFPPWREAEAWLKRNRLDMLP